MNIDFEFLQRFENSDDQHVFHFLEFWNKVQPKKTALIDYNSPSHKSLTFSMLYENSYAFVNYFSSLQLPPQSKALVFLKPGLNFHALLFALFRAGIVPVFLDPAIPRAEFLKAVKLLKPVLLIGEPLAIWFAKFYSDEFSSIEFIVSSKKTSLLPYPSLEGIVKNKDAFSKIDLSKAALPKSDELAAILYTSGGTGIPKGVAYTHKIFFQQTLNLKFLFDLDNNDIDYPGFPLFSMFTLGLGMQSGITRIDPKGPANCNPHHVAQDLILCKATFAAGSPAIWEKVAKYTQTKNFPDLKHLVMFGAPVTLKLHQKWAALLPNGTTHTPYGATESLPISSISGKEILNELTQTTLSGFGTCVGKPAKNVKIAIVKISDEALGPYLDSSLPELPAMNVGEICVQGPIVTESYVNLDEETKNAKILTKDGLWHRMGDLGYKDSKGRLWFLGRKKQRLEYQNSLLSTESIEPTYNNHPNIKRSALIWAKDFGEKVPAVAIELEAKSFYTFFGLMPSKLQSELEELKKLNPQAKMVKKFVLINKMPVDVRHNIKIDRNKLSAIFGN